LLYIEQLYTFPELLTHLYTVNGRNPIILHHLENAARISLLDVA